MPELLELFKQAVLWAALILVIGLIITDYKD